MFFDVPGLNINDNGARLEALGSAAAAGCGGVESWRPLVDPS